MSAAGPQLVWNQPAVNFVGTANSAEAEAAWLAYERRAVIKQAREDAYHELEGERKVREPVWDNYGPAGNDTWEELHREWRNWWEQTKDAWWAANDPSGM